MQLLLLKLMALTHLVLFYHYDLRKMYPAIVVDIKRLSSHELKLSWLELQLLRKNDLHLN